MPTIKSSADLEIITMKFLHFVIIIQNQFSLRRMEKGDLAVMSIEAYENLASRFELYNKSRTEWTILHQATPDLSLEAMADIRESPHTMSYQLHITSIAEHDIMRAVDYPFTLKSTSY